MNVAVAIMEDAHLEIIRTTHLHPALFPPSFVKPHPMNAGVAKSFSAGSTSLRGP